MKKILIVEDDMYISQMLSDLLRQNNYDTVAAYSGTEALLLLQTDGFLLILLDLMLPGKTGDQVLTEIRKNSAVPVIVLTAQTDKETTVRLLQAGADDYIEKPFDNNELLARIEVQLRHALPQKSEIMQFKDIFLDLDGYDAVIKGEKCGLTKREFEIIKLMMSHPNKVFTKNNIYESVWGGEFLGDDNTVNVHISKLRAKLSNINHKNEYIQTVWGIGFKMAD
ncbi:MAG: response regulator transcription factor [Oscillospiraceae bacterium]|jgi:DNA-binding response OmpR family regulator|nr:response regulator transcription factor [Oscillospiraceae bacterium]